MSATAKTWVILLFLPILAAFAHDFYANYANTEEKRRALEANVEAVEVTAAVDKAKGFQTSDVGYLFVTYAPDFFNDWRGQTDPAVWNGTINPVLELPTPLVAAVPLGLYLAYLLVAFILGIPPFSRFNKKDIGPDLGRRDRNAGFKYKRR